jgi:hypothetical protein
VPKRVLIREPIAELPFMFSPLAITVAQGP